ncbi:hypothetical protein thsps21_06890 [Pseudomonas sp. No.21]|nr:hypothetical protein TUM20249_04130 [Pseudomonas tohonis]
MAQGAGCGGVFIDPAQALFAGVAQAVLEMRLPQGRVADIPGPDLAALRACLQPGLELLPMKRPLLRALPGQQLVMPGLETVVDPLAEFVCTIVGLRCRAALHARRGRSGPGEQGGEAKEQEEGGAHEMA